MLQFSSLMLVCSCVTSQLPELRLSLPAPTSNIVDLKSHDITLHFPSHISSFNLKLLPVGMFYTVTFVIAALLGFGSSTARSALLTFFSGADCAGPNEGTVVIPVGACCSLGGNSVRSMSYSGVPTQIQFYISGGGHDSCTNGASFQLSGGSGCQTAPDGVNWESFAIL